MLICLADPAVKLGNLSDTCPYVSTGSAPKDYLFEGAGGWMVVRSRWLGGEQWSRVVGVVGELTFHNRYINKAEEHTYVDLL